MTIMPCLCPHSYQDRMYGNQNRVHNKSGKPGQENRFRCTVCASVKTYVESKEEKIEEKKKQRAKKK